MSFTGSLSRVINSKWLILTGEGLCIIATILFVFADRPERYWPFIFPAFVLGSAGAMLTYTHTNIAIFRTSPSSMAGTVGAIFNGALQLGSAIGISAVGSIESSVEKKTGGGERSYEGRAAAYYFLLALVIVEWLAMLVFYRVSKEGSADATEKEEKVAAMKEKTLEDVEEVVIENEKVGVDEEEAEKSDSKDDLPSEVDEVETPHIVVHEVPVLRPGDLNV